jgi:flavin-dependent dehydrogenase
VIGDRRAGDEVGSYFRRFVASLGLDLSRGRHTGGHLTRVRASTSPLRRGQVLVAGDAAGLLDPWTREGISFALRSGVLAGRAVTSDLSGYEHAVQRDLLPEIAVGASVLEVFSRHPGVAHGIICRVPGAWSLFVRLVSGETTLCEQSRRPMLRLALRALNTGFGTSAGSGARRTALAR